MQDSRNVPQSIAIYLINESLFVTALSRPILLSPFLFLLFFYRHGREQKRPVGQRRDQMEAMKNRKGTGQDIWSIVLDYGRIQLNVLSREKEEGNGCNFFLFLFVLQEYFQLYLLVHTLCVNNVPTSFFFRFLISRVLFVRILISSIQSLLLNILNPTD